MTSLLVQSRESRSPSDSVWRHLGSYFCFACRSPTQVPPYAFVSLSACFRLSSAPLTHRPGHSSLITMRRLLALILCMLATVGCTAGPVSTRAVTPVSTQLVQSRPAVDPASGLPVVHIEDLPPEASKTLTLIERNGPFPHRQDGATFENREGYLPARRSGYYKEYTVDTPGADDRGARRIVAGAAGERYWTDDHYDSFAWIAP